MWVSCSKLLATSHDRGYGALQKGKSLTQPWLHTAVMQHIPEEKNRMWRIQIKNNPRRDFLSSTEFLSEIECDLRETPLFPSRMKAMHFLKAIVLCTVILFLLKENMCTQNPWMVNMNILVELISEWDS